MQRARATSRRSGKALEPFCTVFDALSKGSCPNITTMTAGILDAAVQEALRGGGRAQRVGTALADALHLLEPKPQAACRIALTGAFA